MLFCLFSLLLSILPRSTSESKKPLRLLSVNFCLSVFNSTFFIFCGAVFRDTNPLPLQGPYKTMNATQTNLRKSHKRWGRTKCCAAILWGSVSFCKVWLPIPLASNMTTFTGSLHLDWGRRNNCSMQHVLGALICYSDMYGCSLSICIVEMYRTWKECTRKNIQFADRFTGVSHLSVGWWGDAILAATSEKTWSSPKQFQAPPWSSDPQTSMSFFLFKNTAKDIMWY